MTTGKLNCVSANSDKPLEIQWEFPLRWLNVLRRHNSVVELIPKLDLWLFLTLKWGCKQSVVSTGMACQGRARNRMLRKRWIVRNPVVGEDDVTQFVLARSLNSQWPHFSLCVIIKVQFWIKTNVHIRVVLLFGGIWEEIKTWAFSKQHNGDAAWFVG